MIEVRNLSKSYGDKMVVHDVSLKIQKGKITSLIGPNGAGKSTAFSRQIDAGKSGYRGMAAL